jgi:hypothetical protein
MHSTLLPTQRRQQQLPAAPPAVVIMVQSWHAVGAECLYSPKIRNGAVVLLLQHLQIPQYYRNYKTKSAEALSPWFLAQWLLVRVHQFGKHHIPEAVCCRCVLSAVYSQHRQPGCVCPASAAMHRVDSNIYQQEQQEHCLTLSARA